MADFDHNPRGGLTANRDSLHGSAEYRRQVSALKQMEESDMAEKMTLQQVRDKLASWLGGSEACLDTRKVALLESMIAACDAHLAQPAKEKCFCDRMYPDSDPGASCGDCPTRDYKAIQPAQAVDVGYDDALNDAGWAFIEAMPVQLPGPIFNNVKTALKAAIEKWIATRALTSEKAGPAGEWESAFHAQRAAAMRAHTICYETMLARPDVAELGDDGRLHDAIHDILRVDGPASPAPDKEGA